MHTIIKSKSKIKINSKINSKREQEQEQEQGRTGERDRYVMHEDMEDLSEGCFLVRYYA